ncbi:hypothetical protein SAQ01S_12380 [Sphingomonas aquatilis NBRC 16722]|jgi:hypothetical protein|uniref:Uncharacterized protein n=1 Tax=Sphingomonas aquatilis TaxID=93063 RepID=A0AAW3TU81_9SPHN|nr:hypothetical protein [Sphingomonas aquatilis]GEM71472.1 hypothetical protein SAQ01S_12380 [Sphingomonas aquatilis NBRC 16722]
MSGCTPEDDFPMPLGSRSPLKTDVPLALMRMALAILDRDGRPVPACYLQQAIDSYLDTPPAQPGPQLDAEVNAWLERNPRMLD